MLKNDGKLMDNKAYLVHPETGDHFHIGSCLISDKSISLPKFGVSRILGNKELPHSVDLRSMMTSVRNQDNLNSSVGNALAGACEFLIKKNTNQTVTVSRLFIYYNARLIDGLSKNNMEDTGTSIASGIEGLKKYGCCKEETFPYNTLNVNKEPSSYCYKEAAHYSITHAMELDVNLNEMRGCLAEGFPFAFTLDIYGSFTQAFTKGGRVPIPNVENELESRQYGSHTMLAVGYSDVKKIFIIRNSWGEEFGDKGYCYIPYEYMCDKNLCRDVNVIRLGSNEPRQHRDKNIKNNVTSSTKKDDQNSTVTNYPDQEFDYTLFWKIDDSFDYLNYVSQEGKIIRESWERTDNESSAEQRSLVSSKRPRVKFSIIFWIDEKNSTNTAIEQQLITDVTVKVDFCPILSKAEEKIMKHIDQIRSSSTFQIICRGYYKDEDKNPLNLLEFLNHHHLRHIPVLVFTQDKSGLCSHLEKQAVAMGIENWKSRLFISNNYKELIGKVKNIIAMKYNELPKTSSTSIMEK